jgi:hypothetical protein
LNTIFLTYSPIEYLYPQWGHVLIFMIRMVIVSYN